MASSVLINHLTEAEFQRDIEELCTRMGLMYYHVRRSDLGRVTHKGFPDLVIVGTAVIYAELKKQNGRQTPDQKKWQEALLAAGQHAYLWRPADMPHIVAILRAIRPGVNMNA